MPASPVGSRAFRGAKHRSCRTRISSNARHLRAWLRATRRAQRDDCRMGPGQLTVLDTLGSPMCDLRVSVTDRCNLRCG